MTFVNTKKLIFLLVFVPTFLRANERNLQIFPGTKWCGMGNVANTTDHLGIYQGPDLCCRSHDLCPVKIHALKTKFGLFNSRPHTSLHCQCDEQFRNCLKHDGSEKSRLVGEFYFNHLNAPCFTVRPGQRCLKRTWWGKCTKYSENSFIGQWHSSPKFE